MDPLAPKPPLIFTSRDRSILGGPERCSVLDTPAEVDLGLVCVNRPQSFILGNARNETKSLISVSLRLLSPGFAISPPTLDLPPGASQPLTVTVNVPTAATHRSELSVTVNGRPAVGCVVQARALYPRLVVSAPAGLALGTAAPGTSRQAEFTLRNESLVPTDVSLSLVNGAPFSVSPTAAEIPPGGELACTVAFAPAAAATVAGTRLPAPGAMDTVAVRTPAGTCLEFPVTATAGAPAITTDKDTIIFASTPVGKAVTEELSLFNYGATPVTFTVLVSGAPVLPPGTVASAPAPAPAAHGHADLPMLSTPPFTATVATGTIPASLATVIRLRFAPPFAAPFTSTVTIVAGDRTVLSVRVAGHGTAAPPSTSPGVLQPPAPAGSEGRALALLAAASPPGIDELARWDQLRATVPVDELLCEYAEQRMMQIGDGLLRDPGRLGPVCSRIDDGAGTDAEVETHVGVVQRVAPADAATALGARRGPAPVGTLGTKVLPCALVQDDSAGLAGLSAEAVVAAVQPEGKAVEGIAELVGGHVVDFTGNYDVYVDQTSPVLERRVTLRNTAGVAVRVAWHCPQDLRARIVVAPASLVLQAGCEAEFAVAYGPRGLWATAPQPEVALPAVAAPLIAVVHPIVQMPRNLALPCAELAVTAVLPLPWPAASARPPTMPAPAPRTLTLPAAACDGIVVRNLLLPNRSTLPATFIVRGAGVQVVPAAVTVPAGGSVAVAVVGVMQRGEVRAQLKVQRAGADAEREMIINVEGRGWLPGIEVGGGRDNGTLTKDCAARAVQLARVPTKDVFDLHIIDFAPGSVAAPAPRSVTLRNKSAVPVVIDLIYDDNVSICVVSPGFQSSEPVHSVALPSRGAVQLQAVVNTRCNGEFQLPVVLRASFTDHARLPARIRQSLGLPAPAPAPPLLALLALTGVVEPSALVLSPAGTVSIGAIRAGAAACLPFAVTNNGPASTYAVQVISAPPGVVATVQPTTSGALPPHASVALRLVLTAPAAAAGAVVLRVSPLAGGAGPELAVTFESALPALQLTGSVRVGAAPPVGEELAARVVGRINALLRAPPPPAEDAYRRRAAVGVGGVGGIEVLPLMLPPTAASATAPLSTRLIFTNCGTLPATMRAVLATEDAAAASASARLAAESGVWVSTLAGTPLTAAPTTTIAPSSSADLVIDFHATRAAGCTCILPILIDIQGGRCFLLLVTGSVLPPPSAPAVHVRGGEAALAAPLSGLLNTAHEFIREPYLEADVLDAVDAARAGQAPPAGPLLRLPPLLLTEEPPMVHLEIESQASQPYTLHALASDLRAGTVALPAPEGVLAPASFLPLLLRPSAPGDLYHQLTLSTPSATLNFAVVARALGRVPAQAAPAVAAAVAARGALPSSDALRAALPPPTVVVAPAGYPATATLSHRGVVGAPGATTTLVVTLTLGEGEDAVVFNVGQNSQGVQATPATGLLTPSNPVVALKLSVQLPPTPSITTTFLDIELSLPPPPPAAATAVPPPDAVLFMQYSPRTALTLPPTERAEWRAQTAANTNSKISSLEQSVIGRHTAASAARAPRLRRLAPPPAPAPAAAAPALPYLLRLPLALHARREVGQRTLSADHTALVATLHGLAVADVDFSAAPVPAQRTLRPLTPGARLAPEAAPAAPAGVFISLLAETLSVVSLPPPPPTASAAAAALAAPALVIPRDSDFSTTPASLVPAGLPSAQVAALVAEAACSIGVQSV